MWHNANTQTVDMETCTSTVHTAHALLLLLVLSSVCGKVRSTNYVFGTSCRTKKSFAKLKTVFIVLSGIDFGPDEKHYMRYSLRHQQTMCAVCVSRRCFVIVVFSRLAAVVFAVPLSHLPSPLTPSAHKQIKYNVFCVTFISERRLPSQLINYNRFLVLLGRQLPRANFRLFHHWVSRSKSARLCLGCAAYAYRIPSNMWNVIQWANGGVECEMCLLLAYAFVGCSYTII